MSDILQRLAEVIESRKLEAGGDPDGEGDELAGHRRRRMATARRARVPAGGAARADQPRFSSPQ